MSAALKLLEKVNGTPQKKAKHERPKLFVDAKKEVRCSQFNRDVTVAALSRYFRLVDRKRKELEAELNGVKGALRTVADKELRGSDRYYDCVVLGDVRCVRQNRYGEVKGVERDELVGALGEVEYKTMFTEDCYIQFTGAEEMWQFIGRCELAGVELGGESVVQVKPRASIRQRMAELGGSIGAGEKKLLDALAKDSQLAVGVDR